VNAGNTLVIIEHNLGIIKSADWIIDLGLEGGAAGGQIVAEGRLEQVAKVAAAYTGRFLEMRSSRNLSAHEARRTQRSPLPRCDG
jgi:excinuclease UvrABC ATPase subunit